MFMKEVAEQPQALKDTLESNRGNHLSLDLNRPLLFTGMGSSLAAGQLAALYLNAKGYPALALDTSELLHYQLPMLQHYQTIIVSQSGESFEACQLAAQLKEYTAITNTPQSTLTSKASQVFYTLAGKEEAIAATKTFTSTAGLLLQLCSQWANEPLEDALVQAVSGLEAAINEQEIKNQIESFLSFDQPLFLLGRGPSVITSDLGALLLKEAARMHTESLSLGQFRHGPFELLADSFQCILFNPKGTTTSQNHNFAMEMAELGGKVVYVSDQVLTHPMVLSIQLKSIDEWVSPLIYCYAAQMATAALSQKKGLFLGQATLLSKVTTKE
ncbi:SIS domain-containing protein [Fictibacillus terranigra]|uniref:Glutamine--fructose-6-phosphate aminotransferase [isomerizing] n=1 Tax=Fictibacillus terranigra TaxID=3058424 RepID=A0ABT8E7I4_9BACL|nr:SIS domain-containing protein [Fictibacillus sp. CENA-BCM004]MDN4073874.1 SIS domain-containing protein [Fictibacillus sp. CENA-BCM004]